MESKQKHARLRAYLLESTASYTSGAADVRLIFLTVWKRPMSSSDGVTIGSFDLPNRIDRGVKDTPWYAVLMGSVVCTVEPLAGYDPTTPKLQILCSTDWATEANMYYTS